VTTPFSSIEEARKPNMHLPTRLRAPLSVALLILLGACAGTAQVSPDKTAAAPATKPATPPAATGMVVGPDFTSQSVRFRCAGATELEVAYLNLPEGLAFAALHHGGRTVLLQNRPGASGARYVALDEQSGLRWHTKGSEGFLAYLAADHTAKEQVLLRDCQALPPR
jgi:membrane-bound inhibitor of C-type lysozyme